MPFTLLLAALAATAAGDDSLQARILERIQQVPGARVSVAYQELTRPADTLYLRADTAYHAASTMKVPVMIEAFRQSDAGTLPLDRADTLWNRFASIVDGSPYSLNASDDSDSTVYQLVGQPVPMRELIERMITHSSNLATNAVIDRVGAKAVQRTANALGASGMTVLRGVEDQKAYDRGLSNTTTARALANLMAAIERGQAASPASSDSMRAILLRQAFNDEIPAGLPAGTRVAHKTGSITGILHDAAVVYPADGKPYVLVVLTGNIPDGAVATALIADISRLVYAHHQRD
ncbi:MAG TPA: serine hydrolase [Gemmatimonadaceae bacterium]|jgi:beta-lactamase class A|nr:serine hydrolase [Gemmatimonadaceae bacterium]